MYVHRTGFRLPNEPMATHARRRLRLTPSQNPDPSLPPPDTSLWIMHYCQTEQQHQFPSRNMQISNQIRHMMNERVQLQRHGQLIRKEFMLRDGASWPTINLPGNPGSAYPQQPMGYPNDVMAHMNRSQQQAYIQQQGNAAQRAVGPSPAKRPRHAGQSQGHGSNTAIPPPIVPPDAAYDDDDGTVGGDYMDYLTPRDISIHRYIQHHEWLEQIMESPYDTDRIIPGDLGLGRKGELESLTRDFFDAPTSGTPKERFPIREEKDSVKESVAEANDGRAEANDSAPVPSRVGRLEAGKAEEFTKRATEKVAQINSEMEKLRRQHVRRMAKLQKGRALKEAEDSLRAETLEILNGDPNKEGTDPNSKIDAMVMNVFGRGFKPIQDVECLQKGGLEEKSASKEPLDQDYDMVDNFNLDGVVHDTPNQAPGVSTANASQSNDTAASLQSPHNQVPNLEVTGSEVSQAKVASDQSLPPGDSAAEDWIMVQPEGKGMPGDQDQSLGGSSSLANDSAMQSSEPQSHPMNQNTENQPQNLEQTAEHSTTEGFDQSAIVEDQVGNFETNDFGEGIDFGELDTAGDELSGYAQVMGNPGSEALEVNDGAFTDAFSATEMNTGEEPSGT